MSASSSETYQSLAVDGFRMIFIVVFLLLDYVCHALSILMICSYPLKAP